MPTKIFVGVRVADGLCPRNSDGATYRMWFRLPVPNQNPNLNPNPDLDPNPSSPGSSPGTAVPTGTTFVAVVADVSSMTSLLFHCTAIGLRGLWVHKETHPAVPNPVQLASTASCDKLFHLLMTRSSREEETSCISATMRLDQFPRVTTCRHMLRSQCEKFLKWNRSDATRHLVQLDQICSISSLFKSPQL